MAINTSSTHPSGSPIIRFGMALGCFVMLLGCPVSFYGIGKLLLDAHATSQWTETVGVIEKVDVREVALRRYAPDIVYRYAVGPDELRGTRLTLVEGQYERYDGAAQAIQPFQVGAAVKVYYDPLKPHETVLYPGIQPSNYFLLLVPPGCLGLGLWFAYLYWRNR